MVCIDYRCSNCPWKDIYTRHCPMHDFQMFRKLIRNLFDDNAIISDECLRDLMLRWDLDKKTLRRLV